VKEKNSMKKGWNDPPECCALLRWKRELRQGTGKRPVERGPVSRGRRHAPAPGKV